MLSDHEQRVLDELERCLASGGPESGPFRAGSRWPPGRAGRLLGLALVAVVGCASVFLLFTGVAVAALALATATAIGWLFVRLCSGHVHGSPTSAPPSPGPGLPPDRTKRRFGESVRNYFTWLADAE